MAEKYSYVFREEHYIEGKLVKTEFGGSWGNSFPTIKVLASVIAHDVKTDSYDNMQGESMYLIRGREKPLVLRRTGLSRNQFSDLVKKVSSFMNQGEK